MTEDSGASLSICRSSMRLDPRLLKRSWIDAIEKAADELKPKNS